jgi:hypothetical protein
MTACGSTPSSSEATRKEAGVSEENSRDNSWSCSTPGPAPKAVRRFHNIHYANRGPVWLKLKSPWAEPVAFRDQQRGPVIKRLLEIPIAVMVPKPRGRFPIDPFCRFGFSVETAKAGRFSPGKGDADKPSRSSRHFNRLEIYFRAEGSHPSHMGADGAKYNARLGFSIAQERYRLRPSAYGAHSKMVGVAGFEPTTPCPPD